MTEFRHKNLLIRVVTALAMIPPVLAITYLGFPYFNILIAAAIAAMAWEWSCMVGGGRFGYQGWILGVGLLAAIVVASMGAYIHALLALGLTGVLLIAISEAMRLTVKLPIHSEETDQVVRAKVALWMASGAFYIGIPCVSLIWIRNDWDNGLLAVIWLLVLVWSADSGAYAAGRLIGGPKMAPRISPNKTWAGLGGCVVAAAIAGVGVAQFAGLDGYMKIEAALISGLVGMVSQGGDLVESAFKRHFGVKDSSHLIPGHGGVLDRVDALLAAVVAAALINLTSKVALVS